MKFNSFSIIRSAAVILGGMLLPLGAQQTDYNSLRSVIRLTGPEKISGAPNQTLTLDLVASMKPGYHVASNVATAYPMKVKLLDNDVAQLQNVAYPTPKSHQLAGETLSVFDGDVHLKLTLKIAPHAPVGRTVI